MTLCQVKKKILSLCFHIEDFISILSLTNIGFQKAFQLMESSMIQSKDQIFEDLKAYASEKKMDTTFLDLIK